MLVYRLCNPKYSNDLSGTGAAITGGRWNKKGRAVLYTSESTALALLEVVVNIPPMFQPTLNLLTLEIPENLLADFNRDMLPGNWFKYPAPTILAEIGENFYRNDSILGIKVPSSVVSNNSNIILNPNSKVYPQVKIISNEPFIFDPRLYRKSY
ncbi:RES family NAD+ phosphorylase [Aquiflexum sp. TKW24L]|uniref:RES family NAD+ phosphorylase n=1 Tax=Aquiflexum sp. TKW24L TaxID=2942212 RepID=UPI0020BFFE9C|nr:RES family NAD+ phosphorylase [Aquiflexum sp. TKW24L]MCL6258803.1 RES family NAD+ phosphorylase [Aquiflexum sp. TKW24L]